MKHPISGKNKVFRFLIVLFVITHYKTIMNIIVKILIILMILLSNYFNFFWFGIVFGCSKLKNK